MSSITQFYFLQLIAQCQACPSKLSKVEKAAIPEIFKSKTISIFCFSSSHEVMRKVHHSYMNGMGLHSLTQTGCLSCHTGSERGFAIKRERWNEMPYLLDKFIPAFVRCNAGQQTHIKTTDYVCGTMLDNKNTLRSQKEICAARWIGSMYKTRVFNCLSHVPS